MDKGRRDGHHQVIGLADDLFKAGGDVKLPGIEINRTEVIGVVVTVEYVLHHRFIPNPPMNRIAIVCKYFRKSGSPAPTAQNAEFHGGDFRRPKKV